jgi:hypothetical protein
MAQITDILLADLKPNGTVRIVFVAFVGACHLQIADKSNSREGEEPESNGPLSVDDSNSRGWVMLLCGMRLCLS